MKRRKLALAVMALCCIFMMALVSPVLAENRVEVKVTSEPIPLKSPCDKAGGYTMEFDTRTEIYAGQQITIDLPPMVSLCKTIDIAIQVDDTTWTIPADLDDARSCYEINDDGVLATPGAIVTGSLHFVLTGTIGTQRVTIDVVEAGTGGSMIEVQGDEADRFVLKFLDFPALARDDVFEKDAAGDYVDATEADDNIRCINVSQYDGSEGRVLDNIDSRNDRFTFIPSNPQVAHPITPRAFECLNCPKQDAGNIIIPTLGQHSSTCDFDYESTGGYCFNTNTGNNKVLMSHTSDLPDGDYFVTLEVVDTPGVYWSSLDVYADAYDTVANACEATSPATDLPGEFYYLANGLAGSPVASSDCDLHSSQKVVKVVTEPGTVASANDRVMWVDLPLLVFDTAEIVVGTTVQVRVTVSKYPCGAVSTCLVDIGVLGCDANVSSTLLYPYFTEMENDLYWDGLAVTNLSSYDGVAKLTIYEADGDTATYSLSVQANSIQSVTGEQLAASATQTGGTGTLGDARFYVMVDADFSADGLGMFANSGTGESLGYLPRNTCR